MTAPEPRRLRLLRIDDDVHLQQENSFELDHLEAVMIGTPEDGRFGIQNWAEAIRFWKTFSPSLSVDLVVSDIRFLDETSPLSRLGSTGKLELPTGIGHFKPFAMMARLRGMPLGLGVHTAEPSHWEMRAEDAGVPVRAMSMLAAHDIGELAAILNDAEDLPEGGLEACWAWLREKTTDKKDHRAGICVALRDYRKQLKSAAMRPSDWQALESWCRRMHAAAKSGGGVVMGRDPGPGITLLHTDGTPETPISITSIFADVAIEDTSFVFERDPLPARCFELPVESEADFYLLDEHKRPRIGSLIAALGQDHLLLAQAIEIVDRFPIPADETQPNFVAVVGNRRDRATALAILLQDIRCEHELFCAWESAYSSSKWDPVLDEFPDQGGRVDGSSLKECVEVVYKYICHQETRKQDLDESDVFQSDYDISVGMTRCLNLLCELGLVELLPQNTYRAIKGKPIGYMTPPLPAPPPRGFTGLLHSMFKTEEQKRRSPQAVLNQSLGITDYQTIRRYLSYGFRLATPSAGTEFMDAFRRGQADERLKAICRDYAEHHLKWIDRKTWPSSIR